jgi:hypothetical protein
LEKESIAVWLELRPKEFEATDRLAAGSPAEIVTVQLTFVIGGCAFGVPFQEIVREAPPPMTNDN